MGLGSCAFMAALSLLQWSFCLGFAAAVDVITPSQYIKDPEAIVSAGNKFRLGFFRPGNSENRYVGIWYNNLRVKTPIWVANRNKPLNDSSGILTIADDGNLVVLNGWKEILWSSNVSNRAGNTSAQLMDDGNLVLRVSQTGNSLWQSFLEPSDTYLPNMRLSANARTGEKTQLKSWKTPSDPSIGSFSSGINILSIPEFFVWNGSRPIWRTGPWNGQVFIGVPEMNSVYLDGFDIVRDENGTFYLTLGFANESYIANYALSSEGKVRGQSWDFENQRWEYNFESPEKECDFYGKCGPFGSCSAQNSPICSCLRGFEPKNADEWNRWNWTSGCVRSKSLQCERIKNGGEVGREDGFLRMEGVKVPDFAEWSSSATEQECRDKCMSNCSCIAYAYYTGIFCMLWRGNLTDIQKFPSGGADLYIRLAYSELEKKGKTNLIISITVVVGSITIAVCVFFGWRWTVKYRERKKCEEIVLTEREEANVIQANLKHAKFQELPLFNLQTLKAATDDFHTANKLGEGGFGPVYKGVLHDGQEIAVKRLSRASGQGLEEFMNEVVVISKLQHRNLVKLLGCCVEGEEKMLIYEYMPNKSLDVFLFDSLRRGLLDWKRRFNIIEAIARGLLYLHRDSRLRIIHRDLKASNILLDQEMNPKISDFGMARIFGGNEDQAKTRRVVGTYGYMSPEYAMQGRFSEKSDVFSFGVLLLEIISGRRNSGFHGNEQASSLLSFAWKLWNEGNIAALVDSSISDPFSCQVEIFRCIHIGLLCVQEFAKDRPAVSTVISMLNSEIMDLPTPKRPAFSESQDCLDTESSQQNQSTDSRNSVTVTLLVPR